MARNEMTRRTEEETQSLEGHPVVKPRVDIFENDEEYLMRADLPGVTHDELDIRLEEGELTLKGRWDAQEDPGGVVGREFRPLAYSRTFLIPDTVDAERVDATLRSGLLEIHLPKAEAVKPRRIDVKVG